MVRLYLDTGEPDAATSCKSGSEGGGWKSAHWVTRRPPTLLDGTFFLDLPGPAQRAAIWQQYLTAYQLDQRQRRPDDAQWTGAEIKSCCRLAALLDVPLVEAARHVVPVAVTAAESVTRLRTWADGRCLDAEQPGLYAPQRSAKAAARRRVDRSDPAVN
jgi:hypothetical protein